MRIIAGKWRSHRLSSEGRTARPTTDRARQVLFDIVGDRIVGARVLDLFAGSGAIGLEALSRGADFAIFVDQDAKATNGIRRIVSALAAQEVTEVWTRRASSALQELSNRAEQFDWIFADPPYGKGEDLKVLTRIGDSGNLLLRPGGWLLLEVPSHAPVPADTGALDLERERTVGGTTLRFYRRVEGTEGSPSSSGDTPQDTEDSRDT
ncbi:MAG: 16S rRNA (guanine(966)-N(2))-methyltransferase RsmD [Candidatus Eisenbacteria bacterium]